MKKLFLIITGFAFICMIGMPVLAQPKNKESVKAAPQKSVAKASSPTTLGGYSGATGLDGVVKFQATESTNILLGGSITTSSAAGAPMQLRITVVGQTDLEGFKGAAKPHWSLLVSYMSNALNTSGVSNITLGYGLGVTIPLTGNTSLTTDVFLAQYSSTSGPGVPGGNVAMWTLLTPTFTVLYSF